MDIFNRQRHHSKRPSYEPEVYKRKPFYFIYAGFENIKYTRKKQMREKETEKKRNEEGKKER